MSQEIQPADPRLRTVVLVLMTLAGMLGAAGLLYLDAHLTALLAFAEMAPPVVAAERFLRAARIFLGLSAAIAVLVAGSLARVSWRTLRSERFPPPGSRVTSDTPVLRGSAARRRGLTGLAVAVLMLGATALAIGQLDNVLRGLLIVHPGPPPLEKVEPPVPEALQP